MTERRPNRTLGPNHDTFWEYCDQEQFRLQKCDTCGKLQWPPTPMCADCLSEQFTWTEISGRGRINTYCTFERLYYPECLPPWDVVLVELDEGPLFMTDPKDISMDEVERGTPVKVAFLDCEDDAGPFKLPVFERA